LNRARSNLERAAARTPHCYLEDLCLDAQQAAEKAIKAVLLARRVKFPYVHDLDELLGLVRENGIEIPSTVGPAGLLSRYAFSTRYPGTAKAVTEQQHQEALAVAEAVVRWAEEIIVGEGSQPA
jgi:HEPN domain-containing protein